jgi:hypothetical protein
MTHRGPVCRKPTSEMVLKLRPFSYVDKHNFTQIRAPFREKMA